MSFVDTYGDFADGYIHVHHVEPISEIGSAYKIDPVADLRPLCPNCHAAIHRTDPLMTPDELRAYLKSR